MQTTIELSDVSWMRAATGRAAGVSISLGGLILHAAKMDNLTAVEVVLVKGGGLFIRPAPLVGAEDFEQEPTPLRSAAFVDDGGF
jgi:hypothetical protein